MSIFSKYRPLVHLLAATLLLPLVCACSSSSDEELAATPIPDTPTSPDYYINLSIVVSSGNEGTMRVPTDEDDNYENGDGREKGSERENTVTGITLLLYQDENGINMTNTNTKFDFVRYYAVDKKEASVTDMEISYTTGNQPLKKTDLELDKTYHAIVVANWDLTGEVNTNTTVADFREKITNTIYSGTDDGEKGIGINAYNFVMASERDFSFKLENITPKNKDIDGKPALVYSLDDDNNPIVIERLAARMDFWAAGVTYKTKPDGEGKTVYKTPGYEYEIEDSNGDKFVLTAIAPFNLYDKDEYLIKRITKNEKFSDADYTVPTEVLYLEDERYTTGNNHRNFVLDPLTGSKTGNEITKGYMKTGYALDDFLKETGSTYDSKRILMSDVQKAKSSWECIPYEETTSGIFRTGDNMIVCYPKENTLWVTTPLYYYATGLCIEGDYYEEGWETATLLADGTNPKVKHYTYYGFLRHQGEPLTGNITYYNMVTADELENYKEANNGEDKTFDTFPMNFGVVRNNIYRISIDRIGKKSDKPEIKLQIQVKMWDVFEHDIIYM